MCSLHAFLCIARLVWLWLFAQVERRRNDDDEIGSRLRRWLRKVVGRLPLVRAYDKWEEGHGVSPYLSGDDASALLKNFASANNEVFQGNFQVVLTDPRTYIDRILTWQDFLAPLDDMRRLLKALFIWSEEDGEEESLELLWAMTEHRRVAVNFRNAFAAGNDPDYLHMIEYHLGEILCQGAMYPYAADSHESIQGKFKKYKRTHTSQGGGVHENPHEARWDWMRQILTRHWLKQDVAFSRPEFTPEALKKKAQKQFL